MTRELLILRHGKSDWSAGTDDYHRPLKKRGMRGAELIAKWLSDQTLVPDYVVSSPATRAIDTARRVLRALDMEDMEIHADERVYEASLEQLLDVLGDCPAVKERVLLAGHNPGLEELLLYLVPTPPMIPEDGKLLPTAALASLIMPDDWQSLAHGGARLLHLVKPSALQ